MTWKKCLGKLDEFSRQLIARHVLQEHDRWGNRKAAPLQREDGAKVYAGGFGCLERDIA